MSAMPFDVMTDFPESVSVLETDYQQIIVQLQEGQRRMKDDKMSFQYQDMMDYYTVWAHQIKTPIAAMRLTLQNTDSSFSKSFLWSLPGWSSTWIWYCVISDWTQIPGIMLLLFMIWTISCGRHCANLRGSLSAKDSFGLSAAECTGHDGREMAAFCY